jgi:large subunit ribosomal protein L3
MNSLIGKKIGMTRVFGEGGEQIPVTVIQLGPCKVVQRKTEESDGYSAAQLGFEEQKPSRVSKGLLGHFAKADVTPLKVLCEVIVPADEEIEVGSQVTVSALEGAEYVDVTGVTKGRGYQGVMRRHNMAGQRKTHGSTSHRRAGSIGQCEFPARVFKGKKMPGQMGHVNRTVQNLKVVAVRDDEGVILVRGGVPGPNGGIVVFRQALKKAKASS